MQINNMSQGRVIASMPLSFVLIILLHFNWVLKRCKNEIIIGDKCMLRVQKSNLGRDW